MAASIARHLPPGSRHVCIGLSGGLDSMVLLAVLLALRDTLGLQLSAVHVHHGLSPHADAWADFVAAQCAALQVPCRVERVRLSGVAELGVEAAARNARYAVLSGCEADAVMLAHHRNDQAETVLLNLLRGAGPAGLAAMPPMRRLTPALLLLRPLLDVPRAALLHYAQAHGLAWIEDESNADTRFDRNFLRLRALPLLRERFAGLDETLARAAAHLAEAQALLSAYGALDAQAYRHTVPERFDARRALAELGEARARHALRIWLGLLGIVPDERAFAALWAQTLSRPDAQPSWRWRGHGLRRHRGQWYPVGPLAGPGPALRIVWRDGQPDTLAGWQGRLVWQRAPDGLAPVGLARGALEVRPRQGGEVLQVRRHGPHRPLKLLFQEAGVPPWLRECLPLLYLDGTLVAVPGVALAAAATAADGWWPQWQIEPAATP
ncbi:tRNA lysidine(34) synthetase TilS [Chitiniphilus purpureus]|uniref:tRNA(Ile)-lysidine synthase n=1 Tax=Chitiniphilus purpureus TaxID=2981137 RepID=A0ABY6DRT9_9NEIS|nr:tRNA lysidine(34) synthetase TilS [Chitiniphilus sp. CD1]UXY17082.1 tRNA lysidine(34) synthetase TilS [Chitiniphilus sp. CD1]